MGLFKKKSKIFCIGQNKTGTTSLNKFFSDHGFKVGNQRIAELLIDDYTSRNWKPILKYCESAEVFQDIPFSNDFLYVLLDYYFPNSKFILSERDSPEQWYNSLTKFHTKKFGRNGNVPNKEDLMKGNYIYEGFIWKSFEAKYGENKGDIYNKDYLLNHYISRNNKIEKYFEGRSNFIKININDVNAVQKLAKFVNVKPFYDKFPWENKTSSI